MYAIGVLNTKGGSGKTTITACLAVRAAHERKVAVVDLDPQSSYSEWFGRRRHPNPADPNPALLVGEDRASDAIEALTLASPYDLVFVDGPTNALLVTEDAVKASTIIIIPMKASGLDLAASQDVISLCQDMNKPFLVVINDKGQHDGKLVEEATSLLFSWRVPIAKTVIAHRIAYVNAITTGKTGPEKDKKASDEIDALWTEVKAVLRRAAKARSG
jgi:chromosome partitioning protein